jgi:hypothetical protein
MPPGSLVFTCGTDTPPVPSPVGLEKSISFRKHPQVLHFHRDGEVNWVPQHKTAVLIHNYFDDGIP